MIIPQEMKVCYLKPNLILISHGQLAEHAHKSAEMIMGEIDGMYSICMMHGDGLEGTTEKLGAVLDKIGADAPVVIVADMMAGTPCNVAVQAMYGRDNVRVVAGLNLPMAIEYAVSDEEGLDEMAGFLCEVGCEAVKVVEKPRMDNWEEGYED